MSVQSLEGALPALARWEATLAGVGHVYDQSVSDPTPDAIVTAPNGTPTVIHIAPWQGNFDLGVPGSTPGYGSNHVRAWDRDWIQSWFLFRPFDQARIGSVQRLARPYILAYHELIRAHNKLVQTPGVPLDDATNPATTWQAAVDRYTAGPQTWGGKDYYTLAFVVGLIHENALPTGS